MIIGSTLIKSTLLSEIITVFEVASVKLVGTTKTGIWFGTIAYMLSHRDCNVTEEKCLLAISCIFICLSIEILCCMKNTCPIEGKMFFMCGLSNVPVLDYLLLSEKNYKIHIHSLFFSTQYDSPPRG